METTRAGGAVPTMDDGYLSYEGILDNSATTYGSGNGKKYTINTDIYSNIGILLRCFGVDENVGDTQINIDNPLVDFVDNNPYTVYISVPDGCTVRYKISGSQKTESTDWEQEERPLSGKPVPVVTIDWDHGHSHDGKNSKKIAYSDLTGVPGVDTDTFMSIHYIDSPYTYGSFEPFTGDGGFVVPFACKLTKFSYCKDDGATNVLKDTYSISTSNSIAAGDNLKLVFRDDSGTDKVTLYKNGVVFKELGATGGAADPGGSNRNTWTLFFSTI